MSLDVNTFKNYIINEVFEYNNEGKRINRDEGGEKFNLLSEILRDCKAFIAGGSVLGAYIDSSLHDVDIYVNQRNAIKLRDRLKELGYDNISRGTFQAQYDSSFFVKNNIIARFPIRRKYKSYDEIYIDIIIVSDNTELTQVVTNFDLTFCEVWYDGENVHAVDPKGILEKKGYLKKDYVENLLKCMNKYTIARMAKYDNKGFEIKYDPTSVKLSEYVFKGGELSKYCNEKVVTSPEKWVVTILFKAINAYLFEEEDVLKFINVNHLLKNNISEIRKFNELLPVYRSKTYWKEPRRIESVSFFRNIIFDILCNCNINNYSIESVTNLFNYLGVPLHKRRKFTITLLHNLRMMEHVENPVYFDYIRDVINLNKEDIINIDMNMEEEEEVVENNVNMRKRKRGDSEDEEEEGRIVLRDNIITGQKRKREDSDSEEEEVEDQIVLRNNIVSLKRKRDDYDSDKDEEFTTADISNITTRMAHMKARDEDNIIRKKRRTGDDSGDEEEDVIFVNKINNKMFQTMSCNRPYLETIIRNENNLFLECNNFSRRVDHNIIYVKIPLNDRKRVYCFISLDDINDLLSDDNKVYYLYPVLKNGRQKIIRNFSSLGNLNRCEINQNIFVYRIDPSAQIYFEGTEIDERF
jgi:hypothetical protein